MSIEKLNTIQLPNKVATGAYKSGKSPNALEGGGHFLELNYLQQVFQVARSYMYKHGSACTSDC